MSAHRRFSIAYRILVGQQVQDKGQLRGNEKDSGTTYVQNSWGWGGGGVYPANQRPVRRKFRNPSLEIPTFNHYPLLCSSSEISLTKVSLHRASVVKALKGECRETRVYYYYYYYFSGSNYVRWWSSRRIQTREEKTLAAKTVCRYRYILVYIFKKNFLIFPLSLKHGKNKIGFGFELQYMYNCT